MSGVATGITTHYDRLAQVYDQRWQRYHHTIAGRVLRALQLRGTERLLDVGCGTGEFGRRLLPRHPSVTIVGADATLAMLRVAQRKLAAASASHVLAQAEALPFISAQFDTVVCASMLHCVPEPRFVLQEIARVLRPDRRVVVVDWSADFWHCRLMQAWLRRTNPTFVRMYRVREMGQLLAAAGLEMEHAEQFLAPPCYGLWLVRAVKSPTSCRR